MGRKHDCKSDLAHRKGSDERCWCCELSPSRSPPNLCPGLPRLWRRVRTDSVSLGAGFGSDDRALSRVQAEDSVSDKRSYRYRAKYLSPRKDWGRVADNSFTT